MEHFITEIHIKKLRHLTDLYIPINSEKKQHLLITGKNGSGKTSLLRAIQESLLIVNYGGTKKIQDNYEKCKNDYMLALGGEIESGLFIENHSKNLEAMRRMLEYWRRMLDNNAKIQVMFKNAEELNSLYTSGQYITAYFAADRKTTIELPNGVEEVKLEEHYDSQNSPGNLLLKYMVHLKTQQSYARNEGDIAAVERIQQWFERLEKALKVLLDNDSISLEYDYREYNFKIREEGREPFQFNQLSDGYSSLINIVSDLILRMDQNWLLRDQISSYDVEGIVLIDELETHLHIELQKKVLPFLTEFFPGIQFIVSTHSPYILNSISNAKCYDLEKHTELENLSLYSSDDLAEAYFNADEYSLEMKNRLERYRTLVEKKQLTENERAERAELRIYLKDTRSIMSKEIKQIVDEIESSRKNK